jgi:hypothetical protein
VRERICVCAFRVLNAVSCRRIGVVDFGAGTSDCSYATGLSNPSGVALELSSGALYVTSGYSSLCRVPAGGGAFVEP